MYEINRPGEWLRERFAQVESESDGWRAKDHSIVPVINAEHILVAADMHFPKHDQSLIMSMLERAWREEVTDVVHAGDVHDMEGWSRFPGKDGTDSHRRNMVNCGKLFRIIDDMGFRQHYIPGNHEWRMTHNSPLTMLDITSMMDLGDLVASGRLMVYDTPRIRASIGNWYIVHPSQYGSFPGVVAAKLATRFQANVIAAHEHHYGLVTDETGQFLAISSGGLYDPDLHEYIQNNVTAHRAWQRGYVLLHEGEAHMVRGEPRRMVQAERLVEAVV